MEWCAGHELGTADPEPVEFLVSKVQQPDLVSEFDDRGGPGRVGPWTREWGGAASWSALRSSPDQVVLRGMTHKVGPEGQVVIPKDLRDVLGIEPGDEVTFWRDGDHLEGTEPAASRVQAELEGDNRPVMSWINLAEVFSIVGRLHGHEAAESVVRDLRPQPDLDLPDAARVLQAATVKADHALGYADAFAAATALARRAPC